MSFLMACSVTLSRTASFGTCTCLFFNSSLIIVFWLAVSVSITEGSTAKIGRAC